MYGMNHRFWVIYCSLCHLEMQNILPEKYIVELVARSLLTFLPVQVQLDLIVTHEASDM